MRDARHILVDSSKPLFLTFCSLSTTLQATTFVVLCVIGLVSIFHYIFNEQGTKSSSGEHHMSESPINRRSLVC